jgi:hypothetical protein
MDAGWVLGVEWGWGLRHITVENEQGLVYCFARRVCATLQSLLCPPNARHSRLFSRRVDAAVWVGEPGERISALVLRLGKPWASYGGGKQPPCDDLTW